MKKLRILLALAICPCLFGQQMPNDTERLAAVGRLWVTVNYFHPYVAEGRVDWDAALADALPAIRAAKMPTQYANAVQAMLAALDDPATHMTLHHPRISPATLLYKTEGAVLVVSQTSGEPQPTDKGRLRREIQQARNIVFDLRGGDNLSGLLDEPSIANELTPVPLDGPGQRIWIHHGLPPATDADANFYSAFETKAGPHFSGDAKAKRHRIVFLIDWRSRLPAIACALAGNGKAAILSSSAFHEVCGAKAVRVGLDALTDAVVRVSEPVFAGGFGMPTVQHIAGKDAPEQAIAATSLPVAGAHRSPLPPYPTPRAEDDAGPAYPTAAYRVLAAYRIWGAVRYFFAYRDQMDDDWDADFKEFLPRIAGAANARSYNLAIAEFIARMRDSNTKMQSKTLDAYFGDAPVGLRLRLIERKPVIVDVFDPDARRAGIRPGDVVQTVDSEKIAEVANRDARYIPASTRQSLGYLVLQRVLGGPDGSWAKLTVEGNDGSIKQVRLKRSKAFLSNLQHQRSGNAVKLLPGNLGYVDLDRLTPDQVDGMFEQLRGTKAIVFDMRGQAHGTANAIAARLAEKENAAAAILTGSLTLAPDLSDDEVPVQNASYFFVEKVARSGGPRYGGQTVMLIDERTTAAGERAALLFAAANRTRLIGTPTAGAVGDVTSIVVPGGIRITFSGLDLRYANGGEVQRLGLQPSILAAPTIAGVRAGQDEALDTAVEYLMQQPAKRAVLLH